MDKLDELLAIGKQITKELQLFLDEKSHDTDKLNEIRMRAKRNDEALIREWCSKGRTIIG